MALTSGIVDYSYPRSIADRYGSGSLCRLPYTASTRTGSDAHVAA